MSVEEPAPEELSPVTILDGDSLYRRLAPGHIDLAKQIVLSNAYKRNGKPDPEVSVDLATLTSPAESLNRAGRPDFRIGKLLVKDVLGMGLRIRHAPIVGNSAHCLVEGNTSKETCRLLAEKTELMTT